MKLQLLITENPGSAVASDDHQTKLNRTTQVNKQKICEITGAILTVVQLKVIFVHIRIAEIRPPSYH